MNNFHFYGVKSFPKGKKHVTRMVSLSGVITERGLQIGQAICSEKDTFNKKLGRTISEGRALKNPIAVFDTIPEEKYHAKFMEFSLDYFKPLPNPSPTRLILSPLRIGKVTNEELNSQRIKGYEPRI